MVNKRVKKIERKQWALKHNTNRCECETCFLLTIIQMDSAIIGGNRRTIKKLRKQVKEITYRTAYGGSLKDVRFGQDL